ncbi:hypothetical protein [Burkholderia ubonensis]|uniref:hypothetical protein n=1 Tax=Burkholderia ubonensis TaxID=101571 RepID=UPI0007524881|nr:hypothetical protein [Burkholderia ubonensis]KVL00922.1 hypothetical protein WJ45_14540 [Burkholderia ubonensis]KVM47196.1 hypothetical protein WJ58_29300 [Burkholderia ubonensis]KVN78977.1 hypothetical protein WJ67_12245 [Burkholderia ubonensis]KVQ50411.1 hypothetical protein WK04_05545 [Burkholderia ubonensis]KVW39008.1 hypothetical protein WK95_18600 [Burkholderia ubonensis]
MSGDISVVITQEQISALAEQIKQSVTTAQLAESTAKSEFCEIWPEASAGLTALKTVLELVPGVSVLAGAAIAIVLAAGNAASGAVCAKS